MKEITPELAKKIVEAYELDLVKFNLEIISVKRHIQSLRKDLSQLTYKEDTSENDFDTASYLREQIADQEKEMKYLDDDRKYYISKHRDIMRQAYMMVE